MMRVLIVDDHAENRYLLRMLLQGNGYRVEEASDGAQALATARQFPPALIVSDLLMPVMDGYTLLRHWRADNRLKGIPFVVYTATYTEPQDERLALDLGADAFIIKPAEPEPFMARIQAVLTEEQHSKLSVAFAGERKDGGLDASYSEVLSRKLEQKVKQLEEANRELKDEIEERKRSEIALRLRNRAIQAASQGILITDPNKKDNPIVYASAGFERITGYSAQEVLGQNCRFLQGKDTDKETIATLKRSIDARKGCAVEVLNYRKDGTPFWNALSLDPVKNSAGELEHYVAVQNDITHRKELEEQLRQSQKMDAVGRLAGGIAHDFNNLLTVISGYSELILSTPEIDDSVRESATLIGEAGERATALTRQLLGFSRQSILKPEILDLNGVVEQAGRLLQRLIGADIEFSTVLAPGLSLVKVDPGQLDQVLMNLAINARDAMAGGGKLTIETANVSLSDEYVGTHLDGKVGPHVMMAVTDSGVGMTRDVMARIFEPFYTTKPAGKGTGLGLSMVFGIVQQSGGCLHVYSEPGHGTTIKIYLPAVTGETSSTDASASRPGIRGTETILLVEDEDIVRKLAMRSLETYGYHVIEAADGDDALEVAREFGKPIDIVLTDVVIPNISGPELAERLKALYPDIKVLFMSGYTDDAVVRHGLLNQSVAFIQKPFTPFDLARKIRDVLDS